MKDLIYIWIMNRVILFFFSVVLFFSCSSPAKKEKDRLPEVPFVIVLGIAQDAGYPQSGCYKGCCRELWNHPEKKKMVSCLALVDPVSKERWIFDCTPDFPKQLHVLDSLVPGNTEEVLSGIFLTHAHIGHYTGLMYLGRESMNAKAVRVYAMPGMHEFLQSNGPWEQLVTLENIHLKPIKEDSVIKLNDRISVSAFTVPHRDEFSETVGYRIKTQNRSLVFIPDIDKWEKWDRKILDLVNENDYLFLDGTFYKNGEIPGRNMSDIPHPFIEESMILFFGLSQNEKQKIFFIHFNHTNPALLENSEAQKEIYKAGFSLAKELGVVQL